MFKYGIDKLTINKVIAISNGKLKAVLTEEAISKINICREKVEKIASSDKVVYGINTGFGPLCDVQITPEQTSKLQENLLITHAVGVGKPIDKEFSRIMMICKVHALSQGFSGKYQIDPRGHLQLEQVKENLYRAIEMQRGTHERELSTRWKGAEKSNKNVTDLVPLWVVFTIALSLVVLSYSGFRVWLDHTTTPVAEELNIMTDKYKKDAELK